MLQPLWPPSGLTTVSNAQGGYGPYWPDGSFEPYRPAALRDDRFHTDFANINLNGPVDGYFKQDPTPWHMQNTGFLPPRASSFQGETVRPPHQYDSGHAAHQGHMRLRGTEQFNENERVIALNGNRGLPHARHPHIGPDFAPWPVSAGSAGSPVKGEIQYPQADLQFKGKVLVWAHRIYINLIQHSRRNHQQKQAGNKNHPQTNIYPKPPSRSYSNPQIHIHNQNSETIPINKQHRPGSETTNPKGFDIPVDGGFTQWPHNNDRSTFHKRHDHGLRLKDATHKLNLADNVGYQSHGIFPSPAALTAPIYAFQQPRSPAMEAQSALDMLDRLCEADSWQWLDGILLGGCLAYGLEQFDAALQWYKKVLVREPK